MAIHIHKYAEDAHLFLRQVAQELGNRNDIDHAARVTVAVLHTLREKISVEESIHLIAQLPLILKGVYVDGWDITREFMSESNTLEEFYDDIREHASKTAGRDFGDNKQTKENITAVLKVMRYYVPEGEMNHIKRQMPKSIAVLFE